MAFCEIVARSRSANNGPTRVSISKKGQSIYLNVFLGAAYKNNFSHFSNVKVFYDDENPRRLMLKGVIGGGYKLVTNKENTTAKIQFKSPENVNIENITKNAKDVQIQSEKEGELIFTI